METKNIITGLAVLAAVVLLAALATGSGFFKRPATNQSTSTGSANSVETGPVDGTYNFKGKITSVKTVSGGTEIVIEWNIDSAKVETRTFLVTGSTKVTEGVEGSATTPSSVSSLKVGNEVVVDATLDAETVTWTTNSVQILK